MNIPLRRGTKDASVASAETGSLNSPA